MGNDVLVLLSVAYQWVPALHGIISSVTVGTETLSVLAGPQGIRRTAQLPTAIITGAVTFIPCLSSAMGCRSLDASRPPLRLCLFFPHESA
jgi:hypothetical protein